jgi:hypothetical protein
VRLLHRAVQLIAERRDAIPVDAFKSAQFDDEGLRKVILDMGRVRGLDEALGILMELTRGDEE